MATTRRNLLRIGLSGVGLALAAPATAAFAGTAAPARHRHDAADRWVSIDGTFNVRDLGGLTTTGGHVVRSGLVYRSASLSGLTDTGVAQLAALGVVCVVDSRGPQERLDDEDRLPAGVDLVHAEIPNGTFTPTPNLSEPDPAVITVFRSFVTDPQARAGTAAVLDRAAAAELPLVEHDSSGTYRTGWVTAVLLTALGVGWTQILDDFSMSDVAFGAKFTFPEYLEAGFDQARASYGSVHKFLTNGLGFTTGRLTALRRHLLA